MIMNRFITLILTTTTLLVPAALFAQSKGDKAKDPAKGDTANTPVAEKVDFQKQIWPILEKRCIECHSAPVTDASGKAKKPKGGVIFNNKADMLTSKKGKLVVAKKSADSMMIHSISLPADDEDRMPPAKKGDPLAKEEIKLLADWIDQGANFGEWTGKKDGKKDGEKPTSDTPPKSDKGPAKGV